MAIFLSDFSKDKGEGFATIITAGLSLWNIGLAFLIGTAAYHLLKRGFIRL